MRGAHARTRRLTGRSVLVTGAASGIAKAISLRLGEEGAVVGAVDLDGPGAERTAAEITRAGGRAHAYAADIADGEAVERAVAAFARDAGAISGLVNAAGWDVAANFWTRRRRLAPHHRREHVYGPLHVTHQFCADGRRRRGSIVSLASDAGRVARRANRVRGMQGGIVAFSKSIAREHARDGISINVVRRARPTRRCSRASIPAESWRLPRARDPMLRLARPSDYPGLVAFLLSDERPHHRPTISVPRPHDAR